MNKLLAMQTLRRVIELGSFTAAARDLRMSKSAVSKHISQLERELNRPLLIRSTRSRLRATVEGEHYAALSARVLDEIQRTEASLASSA